MGLAAGTDRVDLCGIDCIVQSLKWHEHTVEKGSGGCLRKSYSKCNIALLNIASNFNFNLKSSGKVKACNSQDHLCLFIAIQCALLEPYFWLKQWKFVSLTTVNTFIFCVFNSQQARALVYCEFLSIIETSMFSIKQCPSAAGHRFDFMFLI